MWDVFRVCVCFCTDPRHIVWVVFPALLLFSATRSYSSQSPSVLSGCLLSEYNPAKANRQYIKCELLHKLLCTFIQCFFLVYLRNWIESGLTTKSLYFDSNSLFKDNCAPKVLFTLQNSLNRPLDKIIPQHSHTSAQTEMHKTR